MADVPTLTSLMGLWIILSFLFWFLEHTYFKVIELYFAIKNVCHICLKSPGEFFFCFCLLFVFPHTKGPEHFLLHTAKTICHILLFFY